MINDFTWCLPLEIGDWIERRLYKSRIILHQCYGYYPLPSTVKTCLKNADAENHTKYMSRLMSEDPYNHHSGQEIELCQLPQKPLCVLHLIHNSLLSPKVTNDFYSNHFLLVLYGSVISGAHSRSRSLVLPK